MGQLQERQKKYLMAAQSYSVLCEKYSKSEHFEAAVEAMFRIGEMYLTGQKQKIFGIPIKSGTGEAALIFSLIIRTAPYGKYTARAQFDLGRAREKEKNNEAAIAAYQAVVENSRRIRSRSMPNTRSATSGRKPPPPAPTIRRPRTMPRWRSRIFSPAIRTAKKRRRRSSI